MKHTGQDFVTIERALERDNFLSAESAMEFGLIDKVETARADADEPTGSDGDSGSEG